MVLRESCSWYNKEDGKKFLWELLAKRNGITVKHFTHNRIIEVLNPIGTRRELLLVLGERRWQKKSNRKLCQSISITIEHSTRYPTIEGSNPIGTRRELLLLVPGERRW